MKLSHRLLDEWHQKMLPRLEKIIERTLRDCPETVSVDLVALGDTQMLAKPTIMVTCCSVARVQAMLCRWFSYDRDIFNLKVRKGKVRRSKVQRSKRRLPHRSLKADSESAPADPVMNPFHQERPLCGASIGAYREEHLPPVSYGGVVLVDDQPYGMSVHHLLDSQSDEDDSEANDEEELPLRSSTQNSTALNLADHDEFGKDDSLIELSESETEEPELSFEDYEDFDVDALDSDLEDEHHGDVEGIDPGDGEDILITQPAIDDVDNDFFPEPEDRDEDHLSSHALGHVHASSGIRRWKRQGVKHEIDWALFKLNKERLQPFNLIQGGRRFCRLSDRSVPKLVQPICRRNYTADEDLYPKDIMREEDLSAAAVHCFGRTSGLQAGTISPARSSVRIHQRKTFSRSWHVLGNFGVGGDSGAWVVDNEHGRVCGHVLAWCSRNRIAYICPMEVLLEDMKNTLGALKVCLPGSVEENAVGFVNKEGRDAKQENEVAVELPDLASLSLSSVPGEVYTQTRRKDLSPCGPTESFQRSPRRSAMPA